MKKQHRRSFELFSQYKYYLPGIKAMFILAALFLAGALVANFITAVLSAIAGQGVLDDYLIAISYPIQFIPAMIYAAGKSAKAACNALPWELDRPLERHSGTFWTVLSAAIATICAAIVTEPAALLLPEMPAFFKQLMQSMMNGPLWVTLLCVSVFAPFFEEWLCRGMVLRGLLSRMKPGYAILISAAFFAVIHMNPWQALPAFILGSLFGAVYWKTGSLKLTMLMHCVNNTFSVLMSRMPGYENCDYLWQAMGDMKGYILLYCMAAALLTLFTVRIFAGGNGSCGTSAPENHSSEA